MADPNFINLASAQFAVAQTSVTVSKPTNTADGDFMLASLAVGAEITTAPTGWKVLSKRLETGLLFWSYIYCKTASSEGVSYTWNFGSAVVHGVIFTYRDCSGVHAHTHLDSTTAATVTGPSVTITRPCKMLHMCARRDAAGATEPTYTTAAGDMTERIDEGSNNGTISYSQGWYEQGAMGAPGSVAGIDITATATPTNGHHRTIALEPLNPNAQGRMVIV